jgi:hypothetical protein
LKSFPSTGTIRLWLSKYDRQPDVTQQSFDTIVSFAEGNNAWEDLCTRRMDEIEMQKQVDYDFRRRKICGFTDIGLRLI